MHKHIEGKQVASVNFDSAQHLVTVHVQLAYQISHSACNRITSMNCCLLNLALAFAPSSSANVYLQQVQQSCQLLTGESA